MTEVIFRQGWAITVARFEFDIDSIHEDRHECVVNLPFMYSEALPIISRSSAITRWMCTKSCNLMGCPVFYVYNHKLDTHTRPKQYTDIYAISCSLQTASNVENTVNNNAEYIVRKYMKIRVKITDIKEDLSFFPEMNGHVWTLSTSGKITWYRSSQSCTAQQSSSWQQVLRPISCLLECCQIETRYIMRINNITDKFLLRLSIIIK